jgi:hypothetical protein
MNLPCRAYDFGVFSRGQGLGDLEELRQHGRRVASVQLGAGLIQGLEPFSQELE